MTAPGHTGQRAGKGLGWDFGMGMEMTGPCGVTHPHPNTQDLKLKPNPKPAYCYCTTNRTTKSNDHLPGCASICICRICTECLPAETSL